MLNFRIKAMAGLLVLISSFLLFGCTKKEKAEPTIKLAFWGDIFNRPFAGRLIERYNKTNPSVSLELIPILPAGYEDKLLTMIAGGSPPDIMLLMRSGMIDYASRGILLNLKEFEERDKEFQKLKEDIYPQLLNAGKVKGIPYAVPFWTNTVALFYNETLFDEAGLSYPDENWDWDKFLSAAKKLTRDKDGDGKVDQFGLTELPLRVEGWDLYLYIRQNGGRLFNEDKTKCLIDSPEAIEAIRWCIDLTTKHHVAPAREEMRTGALGEGSGDTFKTSRAAMLVSGRWQMKPFSEIKTLRWSVSPLPRGKTEFMCTVTVFLGVSSKTNYPAECWDFLKFIMGEEGQRLVCKDRGDIPILRSMVNSQEYLNLFSRPKENKVFVKSLEKAEEAPYVLGEKPWKAEMQRKIELVSLGKMELEVACKEIVKEYNNVLQNR